MNIYKACEVFNITDVSDICKKELASEYKKLMRKYHPDNCGSDDKAKEVNEAYHILKVEVTRSDIIKASEPHKEVTITNMYKVIAAYNSRNMEYISKLKRNQSYINVDISIYENGIWVSKSSFVPFRFDCKYRLEVDLNTYEDYKEELRMNICGIKYDGDINSKYKTVILRLSNDVEVTISVTRNIISAYTG